MTMFQPRSIFLLLVFLIGFSACSDDDPVQITHYYNPVWTPDGKTVVAGIWQYLDSGSDAVTGPWIDPGTLAVYDMETESQSVITLPVGTVHRLYSFDPSGMALAFVEDAIGFYSLDGSELLRYSPSAGGTPMHLAFNNTGNSFVWTGATANEYTVNTTQYNSTGWSIEDESTLFSIPRESPIIALALTSQRSVALRFADGVVREYDFDGALLNTFTTTPFDTENPWQQRLMLYSLNGIRLLYFRDGSGLHRFDLESGESRQLVKGAVVDMDVLASRATMVYETGTGDVWIATTDASPLTRIAPQNLMPRFSPAGNGIAMVARTTPQRDTLNVLLLR